MGTSTGIFKAYDIRGIWPEEIDADTGYKVGQAFVNLVKPQKEVLIGRDIRVHSEELRNTVIEGITDAGIDVVDVGLMSTDMLEFGVGTYGVDGGIQITSSHNPPEWHGFKMMRPKGIPISGVSGMNELKEWVMNGKVIKVKNKGKIRHMDIWDDYCKYMLGWLGEKKIRPMKVVINPNFGLAGKVFHKLVEMGNLPLEIVDLNVEPDGTFPKGRPDPFIPENRTEFLQLIKDNKADLGITWDADADRVFFATDEGIFSDAYYTNTMIIKRLLKKDPGAKIVYDVRYTWALIDAAKEAGGEPVKCRVGYVYIKQLMRDIDAIFAGESSGHTFFKNFFFADCGIIPIMLVLDEMTTTGKKLSEIINPVMEKYPISGEINNRVSNAKEIIDEIAIIYKDATLDRTDGLSVEYPEYRFNLRTSNTEPLLRLCLEARDKKTVDEKREEVVGYIKRLGKFV